VAEPSLEGLAAFAPPEERLMHSECWHSVTTRRYASALYVSSCVCPSVRPSQAGIVLKRHHMITQTTPYDSPGTLVFWRQKSRRNSNRVTRYAGAK